jgi:alpha-amylase/alpha-mannosidase (GH57 family)
MSDAAAFAGRIAERLKDRDFISIATDGETYGHHHKFSDLGLAHLVSSELPRLEIPTVNFGYFLSKRAPEWDAEIKRGPQGFGTSWSCAHGVGRWTSDCGCGTDGAHGRWRLPLRQAFDWLNGELARLTEEKGGRIFKDVWAARDAYVSVLLGAPEARNKFMRGQLRAGIGAEDHPLALALMEMQRFSLLMYTSCGWFFAHVSGIEAAQNLRYAARAIELAREISGVDFEAEFLDHLRLAQSNSLEYPNAAAVYAASISERR